MERTPIRSMVLASLMAALMAVGAYIAIPIGPVPIVLQNLFVLLAGLLLGPSWGLASVIVYLLLGLIGLPVFSGGGGGAAHFAGPTGGYLVGYVPAVAVVGALSGKGRSAVADAWAAALGALVVYAVGVPWLALTAHLTPARAAAAGLMPFLPGDALKVAVAVAIARWGRPLVAGAASGASGASPGQR
jgi:biotin transport system substrate-specific component